MKLITLFICIGILIIGLIYIFINFKNEKYKSFHEIGNFPLSKIRHKISDHDNINKSIKYSGHHYEREKIRRRPHVPKLHDNF